MKNWAKILTLMGVVWIIIIIIFLVILYFKSEQFSGRILNESDVLAMGNWKGVLEVINGDSPFGLLLILFLEIGIPAWILFLISFIWGREKISS